MKLKYLPSKMVARKISNLDFFDFRFFFLVLNDEEIDLVFVTTINDTHYDYCKQALLANKHVVIEKPITPTSEEAFELAKLAKSKNLILAVCKFDISSLSLMAIFY